MLGKEEGDKGRKKRQIIKSKGQTRKRSFAQLENGIAQRKELLQKCSLLHMLLSRRHKHCYRMNWEVRSTW